MRKLTADFIFDGQHLVSDSLLTVSDTGQIISLSRISDKNEAVEYYKGILCPGFINAHCHLELSHLKAKIESGKGLVQFVKEVISKRLAPGSDMDFAIRSAESEMLKNGIVGVGDICNSEATFPTKALSTIRYHSFMEIFSPDPAKAMDRMVHGKTLTRRMKQMMPGAMVSITPHAPYSVSDQLFELLLEESADSSNPISIHNQETAAEDDFFSKAGGELFDLMSAFYPDLSNWNPTGLRSLPSYIEKLPKANPLLLVHNTQTQTSDLETAMKKHSNLWFCLCPKANLYIENQLPELGIFMEQVDRIVIGTDSLASNDTLSILEELKTLKHHFPFLNTSNLLKWGTSNPAVFFSWKDLGRFEPSTSPGVNWLKHIENGELTSDTTLEVLF